MAAGRRRCWACCAGAAAAPAARARWRPWRPRRRWRRWWWSPARAAPTPSCATRCWLRPARSGGRCSRCSRTRPARARPARARRAPRRTTACAPCLALVCVQGSAALQRRWPGLPPVGAGRGSALLSTLQRPVHRSAGSCLLALLCSDPVLSCWSSRVTAQSGERPEGACARRAARVPDAAALVMRAVAEGGASAAAPMREAALTEGALLTHLLAALVGQARISPASRGRPHPAIRPASRRPAGGTEPLSRHRWHGERSAEAAKPASRGAPCLPGSQHRGRPGHAKERAGGFKVAGRGSM